MEKPKSKRQRPAQSQPKPGTESKMEPEPVSEKQGIPGSGKLNNKVAFITGGDSGIGKATAILFAKEGADVIVVYLNEHEDARDTASEVEKHGHKCLLIPGDISSEEFCRDAVKRAVDVYGRIDILVNNAAAHWEQESLEQISTEQLLKTFSINIFSMFWITKAALKYMGKGSSIINTSSVTAYRGSDHLIDYAATKSAIVGFTRSLSANLVKKGNPCKRRSPRPDMDTPYFIDF